MVPGEEGVYIYALCEPDGTTVRYIGQSRLPQQRLEYHIAEARRGGSNTAKDAWISELLAAGHRPRVLILERCTWRTASSTEYRVMAHYASQGAALLNVRRRSVAPGAPRSWHEVHADDKRPRLPSGRTEQEKKMAGDRLRALRQRRSLGQAELGHLVGVHASQISLWESGAHEPQPRRRRQLAQALGVDVEQLMSEEEDDR